MLIRTTHELAHIWRVMMDQIFQDNPVCMMATYGEHVLFTGFKITRKTFGGGNNDNCH